MAASPPPRRDALAAPGARRRALQDRLEREHFDLLVIGGGITGAGIAREASLRGLRVALLEARDFAAGTSSRSSKLIHGGLRYLAMGEVALVRSTARERQVIRRMAPHLAQPRWMVVPARSLAGAVKFRAGIGTYERLGGIGPADRHRTWDRDALAIEEPTLSRERFSHAVAYREYLTDDARLVLANLRAAVGAGAVVLSHAPAVRMLVEGPRAVGAVARCALSGRELAVRARAIVNAAGPWVDEVRALEAPDAKPRLHLSKGVHLVLPAARLPVRHLLVLGAEDRRSIFVVPRGACVYVGTTDTSFGAHAEAEPAATRADVAYLLAPLARDLAVEPVAPEEVAAAWAGLRPLVAEPGKPPAEISRKDEVWTGPAGVVTIAGGKLTGYRPMARLAVERAAEEAGLRAAPPAAEEPPLPGGDFDGEPAKLVAALAAEHALPEATAERLVSLYGTEAREVAALGAEPLVPGGAVLRGEAAFAVDVDGATDLLDVLVRRTRAALYLPGERDTLVAPLAAELGARLGWDDARRGEEERRARRALAADLAFLEPPPGALP